MAENVQRIHPPLGFVRDFVVAHEDGHPRMINLKLNGATPIVDGARLIALADRITKIGTLAHFTSAARHGVSRKAEAEAWCDACASIQLPRVRAHQNQPSLGQPLDNHIDPDHLNYLNRRTLKKTFRQARKRQQRLALDYQR